jgi:hypothetical protein
MSTYVFERALVFGSLLVSACGGGNHTLAVTASGPGLVTSSPTGINCRDLRCSATFAAGSTVALTAQPDGNAAFTGWNGACSGSGPSCTLVMNSDLEASAQFSGNTGSNHTFSVIVAGPGSVASTPAGIDCPGQCSASFATGTRVTLTPTPQSNASFTGWSGACTGSGGCSITLGQDATVTATFSAGAP